MLQVGSDSGVGTLTVNGGSVSDNYGYLGYGAGSNGMATITSGTWSNSYRLDVGNQGAGTLTLADSGVVTVQDGMGTVTLARSAGSVGVLNLGESSGLVGTLKAVAVTGGAGSATVNLKNSNLYTLAPGLTGALNLNMLGSGTAILMANNTFSGTTTISNGALQLGDGSTVNGSVTGNIVDNAALTFANPLAQAYSGAISGNGSLTKTGAGTLTLTGSNSYTGITTVSGGTLSVMGSIAKSGAVVEAGGKLDGKGVTGDVTVNSGGTLGGSLVSGAVTVNTGGTLSPGNSPGLYSATSLSINAGGILAVDLVGHDGDPVAGTTSDQTVITGTGTVLSLDATPFSGSILSLNIAGNLRSAGIASTLNPYSWTGGNSALDNYFILDLGNGASIDPANNRFAEIYDAVSGSYAEIDYSPANLFGGLGGIGTFTTGIGDSSKLWAISYTGNSAADDTVGGHDVVITAITEAIPEPTSWGLLLFGAGLMTAMRRRTISRQ